MWVKEENPLDEEEIFKIEQYYELQKDEVNRLLIKSAMGLFVDPYELDKEKRKMSYLHMRMSGFKWVEPRDYTFIMN